jgi:hypothetical protein
VEKGDGRAKALRIQVHSATVAGRVCEKAGSMPNIDEWS